MAKKAIEPVAENQLAVVQEKIKGMQAMITSTKVTNEVELKEISDKIKNIKTLGKYIEQEKEKFTAPAKEIIQQAKDKYDPYIKECRNAEVVLKQRATDYMLVQENIRVRKEAEIAAKVEAGKIKPETAISRMEKLDEAPKNVTTGSSGLRMSKRKIAVIVDQNLIPDEYWVVDEVKVRKVALAGVNIPGVEIREEAGLASL